MIAESPSFKSHETIFLSLVALECYKIADEFLACGFKLKVTRSYQNDAWCSINNKKKYVIGIQNLIKDKIL